jgi:hypothetical protein
LWDPPTYQNQGCRMVYFQTKNSNLGKFLEDLAMDDVGIFNGLVLYFTAIWYILWAFCVIYLHRVILYIFSCVWKDLVYLHNQRFLCCSVLRCAAWPD